jgi:hypothetical protein
MTIWTNQSGNYADDGDKLDNVDRFERISQRQQGACPVRSHAARTRAMMRSRGGPGSRQKARSINGAHRRSRYKRSVPNF